MTNAILGDPYLLAQLLRSIQSQLAHLSTQPVLANASSDGTNGSLAIQSNAVNGQPAITLTYTGGGGSLTAQIYQTTGGAVQITGGLQVSGTKNFVMNHPVDAGYLLRHASTESPVNGVEYWGTETLDATGTAVIHLPNYFEALTKPGNRAIQITVQQPAPVTTTTTAADGTTSTSTAPAPTPQVPAYDPISGGAFTVYGTPGTSFSWLVKAERASQPGDWPIDFDAEEPGEVPGPPATNTPATAASSSLMTADPYYPTV